MRIIFAGTPDIAAIVLEKLLASEHEVVAVYTQPDRPAGRGRQLAASPVKQLAQQHHIPVEQPETFKSPDAQKQLDAYQADLMVVVAYGLLLPQAVLDMPKQGCWNIHVSLLPRWRGAAPTQRAIEAGDKLTGVSVMQMDAGLDTGPILLTRECEISATDTAGELHAKLARLGADALMEALSQLAQGALTAKPQQGKSTYAHKLSKQEAQIDWQQPAEVIERRIRAFNPWPVCYFEWHGQRIKVWRAEVVSNGPASKQPGQVLAASASGVDIVCGKDAVRLLELQLPGGKRQPVASILNGHPQLFN